MHPGWQIPGGAGVLYVCDEAKSGQLTASISSWRRFLDLPVTIVDLGLSDATREGLRQRFRAAIVADASPHESQSPHRRAYRAKARMGHYPAGDPVVFLDADVIVVHPDFFRDPLAVAVGVVAASPSAWDRDFTWTYSASAAPLFRSVCELADFGMDWPIANSGVVAARHSTLQAVSELWSPMFDGFLQKVNLDVHCRPGRNPGDQEFLGLALRRTGVSWHRLHGAHNMQVHHDRMPWLDAEGKAARAPHPRGGHIGESPREVLAVHFGLDEGSKLDIDATMLPSRSMRDWLFQEYELVARLAFGDKTHVENA